MTDPVSAAAPVTSSAIVRLPNPGQADVPVLSRAAEATLNKLTQMQAEFAKVSKTSADTAQPPALSTPTATPAGGATASGAAGSQDLTKSMAQVAQSINSSAAVQQQLAQFVVASSVSSSFGRNLNMFLRGQ